VALNTKNHQIIKIIYLVRYPHCFATFLQKICDMDVLFYPWNFNEDKFRWIANTIDKSDYIVFLISQSAVDQYDMWIREDAYNLNRHSSDLLNLSSLKFHG
jgi:hypothetical protein